MVLNVLHKEVISCANAHLDFQVNVAKIKCKPIHANRILVKTEACVRHNQEEHMVWAEESTVNVHQALQVSDAK